MACALEAGAQTLALIGVVEEEAFHGGQRGVWVARRAEGEQAREFGVEAFGEAAVVVLGEAEVAAVAVVPGLAREAALARAEEAGAGL